MKRILLMSLLATLVVACRAPEGEERWPGSLRVGQEHSSQLNPNEMRIVGDPGIANEDEKDVVRQIIASKEQMFAIDPPQRILDEAEVIFLRTGQLPDLLGYYNEALEDREHRSSSLYPRTGWLYQRLGLENLALETARDAVRLRPQDPFAQFSLAYALGQQADRFEDPYPEMIAALGRVLQISPDFNIAGVVARNQLEGEYRRLREEHGTPESVPAESVPGDTVDETP